MLDLSKPVTSPPAPLDKLAPVEWRLEPGLLSYPDAVAGMESRVAGIREGAAPEAVWLVEHPPLYTAGTSARPEDLLAAERFPVYATGRGGQYTYHGPGQRVAYVMLDLGARGPDLRKYVQGLEQWVIDTIGRFGIVGERREGLVGVWVATPLGYDKIAAIGIRVRRWVSFHGIALNVDPDLGHFSGIVPCGIRGAGVTSLRKLGVAAGMAEVDAVLRDCFEARFGKTVIMPSAAR